MPALLNREPGFFPDDEMIGKLPANHQIISPGGGGSPSLFQSRSGNVRLLNNSHFGSAFTDIAGVRFKVLQQDPARSATVPWALEMKAVSIVEPARLVRTLTG